MRYICNLYLYFHFHICTANKLFNMFISLLCFSDRLLAHEGIFRPVVSASSVIYWLLKLTVPK